MGPCREAGRKTWESEAILFGVAGGFREQLLSRLLAPKSALRCTLHSGRLGRAAGSSPTSSLVSPTRNTLSLPLFLSSALCKAMH